MIRLLSGKSYYQADHEQDGHKRFVAVPCRLGSMEQTVWALLDTAAEWSVLSRSVAEALAGEVDLLGTRVTLHSRFGTLVGDFGRVRILCSAVEGEAMAIDATCFVCETWPGPLVIGWRGCLDRMRFGVDPADEAFYFGPL
jgi:hypothetical protein